jgi:hypothetical protein
MHGKKQYGKPQETIAMANRTFYDTRLRHDGSRQLYSWIKKIQEYRLKDPAVGAALDHPLYLTW